MTFALSGVDALAEMARGRSADRVGGYGAGDLGRADPLTDRGPSASISAWRPTQTTRSASAA